MTIAAATPRLLSPTATPGVAVASAALPAADPHGQDWGPARKLAGRRIIAVFPSIQRALCSAAIAAAMSADFGEWPEACLQDFMVVPVAIGDDIVIVVLVLVPVLVLVLLVLVLVLVLGPGLLRM